MSGRWIQIRPAGERVYQMVRRTCNTPKQDPSVQQSLYYQQGKRRLSCVNVLGPSCGLAVPRPPTRVLKSFNPARCGKWTIARATRTREHMPLNTVCTHKLHSTDSKHIVSLNCTTIFNTTSQYLPVNLNIELPRVPTSALSALELSLNSVSRRDHDWLLEQERDLLPMSGFAPWTRSETDLMRGRVALKRHWSSVCGIIVLYIISFLVRRGLTRGRGIRGKERVEPGKECPHLGRLVGAGFEYKGTAKVEFGNLDTVGVDVLPHDRN